MQIDFTQPGILEEDQSPTIIARKLAEQARKNKAKGTDHNSNSQYNKKTTTTTTYNTPNARKDGNANFHDRKNNEDPAATTMKTWNYGVSMKVRKSKSDKGKLTLQGPIGQFLDALHIYDKTATLLPTPENRTNHTGVMSPFKNDEVTPIDNLKKYYDREETQNSNDWAAIKVYITSDIKFEYLMKQQPVRNHLGVHYNLSVHSNNLIGVTQMRQLGFGFKLINRYDGAAFIKQRILKEVGNMHLQLQVNQESLPVKIPRATGPAATLTTTVTTIYGRPEEAVEVSKLLDKHLTKAKWLHWIPSDSWNKSMGKANQIRAIKAQRKFQQQTGSVMIPDMQDIDKQHPLNGRTESVRQYLESITTVDGEPMFTQIWGNAFNMIELYAERSNDKEAYEWSRNAKQYLMDHFGPSNYGNISTMPADEVEANRIVPQPDKLPDELLIFLQTADDNNDKGTKRKSTGEIAWNSPTITAATKDQSPTSTATNHFNQWNQKTTPNQPMEHHQETNQEDRSLRPKKKSNRADEDIEMEEARPTTAFDGIQEQLSQISKENADLREEMSALKLSQLHSNKEATLGHDTTMAHRIDQVENQVEQLNSFQNTNSSQIKSLYESVNQQDVRFNRNAKYTLNYINQRVTRLQDVQSSMLQGTANGMKELYLKMQETKRQLHREIITVEQQTFMSYSALVEQAGINQQRTTQDQVRDATHNAAIRAMYEKVGLQDPKLELPPINPQTPVLDSVTAEYQKYGLLCKGGLEALSQEEIDGKQADAKYVNRYVVTQEQATEMWTIPQIQTLHELQQHNILHPEVRIPLSSMTGPEDT